MKQSIFRFVFILDETDYLYKRWSFILFFFQERKKEKKKGRRHGDRHSLKNWFIYVQTTFVWSLLLLVKQQKTHSLSPCESCQLESISNVCLNMSAPQHHAISRKGQSLKNRTIFFLGGGLLGETPRSQTTKLLLI